MSGQLPDLRSTFVKFLLTTVFLFLSLGNTTFANTTVSSVRVWPAAEYTRFTLESALPIQYSVSMVKNPDRVVVDLEQVVLTPELEGLPDKIDATDPYIRAVRIGRYKPTVLRLVLDLKTEVIPQAFVLKPVGNYGHRLVLDIYPAIPLDPLMALLNENSTAILQDDANT
ncbi:MAG: AMIN domain-containing protein, partial [Nitrosospira sp.]